jgi:hypothetical protein
MLTLGHSPKVLKGSWTHLPSAAYVLRTLERLSSSCALMDHVRYSAIPKMLTP